MNHHKRWLGLAITCALALSACAQRERPCLEEAECFAGEYCARSGYCAPYKGKVTTTPRQGAQDPQVARQDQDNPFIPTPEPEMGADLDQAQDQDAD